MSSKSTGRKSRTLLRAVLATLLILTAVMVGSSAVSRWAFAAPAPVPGEYEDNESRFDSEGRWELDHEGGDHYLTVRKRTRHDNWSMTDEIAPDAFTGLQAGDDVQFEMRRDAGTFYFSGDLAKRSGGFEGQGRFGFVVNDECEAEFRSLGVRGIDDDEFMFLAFQDVGPAFVRGLKDRGYSRIGGDRLLELSIHGVTLDYIDDMAKAGYDDLSLTRLVEMRIHGVTPQFAREMAEAGYEDASASRLVEWRIHGVSPEWIREMKALGIDGEASSADLVAMRIHDVSPRYVAEMRELGYDDLSMDRLVEMRIHGVSPDFVREIKELGYTDVRTRDLIDMRIHGVSPSFIKRVQRKGLTDVSVRSLIKMKIHGIHLD